MSFTKLRLLALATVLVPFVSGCGGVTGGVADAPDEPQPELTEEEEAGEQEYTNSPEYQGQ